MQCDWAGITTSAYLTLLELDLHEFPIPTNKIKCEGVKISSYQNYAEKSGCSIEEITFGHELDDAFLLKGLRPGLTLILYNKEKYGARMKHTLWHEVGHIKCNHKKHSEQEEIEAHFFAAQANAPNILIKEISNRGYSIDVSFLMECFGLSEEAAKKKKDYLCRYNFNHSNEYDDVVLIQFSDYINFKYPPKTKHFYDDYYDALERERENWY
ncbi:MAG TPA: ImmA/IrrE family metallo-endopeptidase [Clostridia bacterium]|nr:ImmA/IrrE family metallo-endopeptidase [Clostridia bacterium]